MRALFDRFKEPSSYAGIGIAVLAVIVFLAIPDVPDFLKALLLLVSGLALIAVLRPEGKVGELAGKIKSRI